MRRETAWTSAARVVAGLLGRLVITPAAVAVPVRVADHRIAVVRRIRRSD